MTYPPAPRGDDSDVLHGVTVPDPVPAPGGSTNPATIESCAQADLLAEHRRRLEGRARFGERLAELLGAGSVSTPAWRYGRAFFTRRTADQEHAVC